jgi:hypothetical protein
MISILIKLSKPNAHFYVWRNYEIMRRLKFQL